MFEVGKKYICTGTTTRYTIVPVYIDSKGMLVDMQNEDHPVNRVYHDFNEYDWARNYKLVPPEPKWWSEWVNFYDNDFRKELRSIYGPYNSLEMALRGQRGIIGGKVTNHAHTIRFDWEQMEGQEKKLVKTELVGVPD